MTSANAVVTEIYQNFRPKCK